MPLDNTYETVYSFGRKYDDLPPVNLPFRAVESQFDTHFWANSGVIGIYTNPQDPIKLYPDFNTVYAPRFGRTNTATLSLSGGLSATPFVDNYRYFFDFGDGTISDALTAEHYYKIPGTYTVTLVCVDSATNFYRSLQTAEITASNVIPDEIFLTYTDGNTALAGTFENPIQVTRYNSYQSWPLVSANGGYNINLTVSGNKSELVDPKLYYRDPNIHLKKFAAFGQVFDGQMTLVDKVSTNTDFLYARRQKITPSLPDWFITSRPDENTIFVGSSGTGQFYYYED